MMTLKKTGSFLIKYLLLILLFVMLIYFTKSYGDFCSNLYIQLFLLPVLGILVFIYITALYVNDYKVKKFKTTNIVVSFLMTVFLTNVLLGFFNSKKEIYQKYIPETEKDDYELTLYKNQTFKLRKQMNHGACAASGKYAITDNLLKLDFNNKDIENLTDSTFTFSYKYIGETKVYEPLKKGFKKLRIKE